MEFITRIEISQIVSGPYFHPVARAELKGGTSQTHLHMPKAAPARNRPIRLGYVALADCAPIVMAHELGLFEQYGLKVQIHREAGWATVRDKIIYGELDAAQAPAGLMVAVSCGLGCVQADCLTALVLNLHGNGITLSLKLWKCGVRDGDTLRKHLQTISEPLVFGVVHPFSSHSCLLRTWLKAHRIQPDREVKIVTVPPAQMTANLRARHLDGYCVGEPWNAQAVLSRIGWCAATSAELAPGHPEKVLMVQRKYAEQHEEEHLALIAALLESCRFCDAPENRERLVEILGQRKYVGVSAQALRLSLGGLFDFGNGRIEKVPDFHVFSRGGANEPTLDRAHWVIRQMHATGLADPLSTPQDAAAEWFRSDIFHRACALHTTLAIS